ncbi:pseudaminic acid cytidylyltransferase [Sulfurimonas sp. SWIR-19]|uniref:pseudaminic acid cytidylyltransferase n=1 Tax=Sulfurimonas sp. SWIR-19 TaxID=2878390 RepID=UPI001CF44040|nr:pseudaminic acid cytidylyltransferase [Sulfurimonas sp. SWIR-19]UCN00491.1 pseudaminic acid cytidylyltransferase [Sulfurimonas sp. SWIR-19]
MKNHAIAIIPARGGSKRIPKKNIKDFLGKPLIAYSIEAALKSKLFDKVIVSTEDEEIARIAQEYGAEVPFMRPEKLSDDFSSSGEAVSYTLHKLKENGENYHYCCTIYATAPLLQEKYLVDGLEKLKNSNARMAFSVTSMPFPIQRTFKITKEGRCKMFTPEHFSTRSQDLEEAYQDAGQFYWEKVGTQAKDIAFGSESIPVVIPRYLVQDIDTLEDWEQAEILYRVLHQTSYFSKTAAQEKKTLKSSCSK